jgi:hypothetical protein
VFALVTPGVRGPSAGQLAVKADHASAFADSLSNAMERDAILKAGYSTEATSASRQSHSATGPQVVSEGSDFWQQEVRLGSVSCTVGPQHPPQAQVVTTPNTIAVRWRNNRSDEKSRSIELLIIVTSIIAPPFPVIEHRLCCPVFNARAVPA